MLNFKTGELVDLDFYARAGFYDHYDGVLYLVVGSNIIAFSDAATYKTMNWKGKELRYRMNALGCVKIIATSYPVTMDLIFPTATVTVNALDSNPHRLPPVLAEQCSVRIYGAKPVTSVHIANTLEELPI